MPATSAGMTIQLDIIPQPPLPLLLNDADHVFTV
jgi:hypothetical protein